MSDVWKQIAVVLSGVLLTGLASWFSFGGGVSAAEGQELRDKDSELMRRQAVLEERLTAQQSTLNEVKQNVKEGNATTQSKLDAILLALPRENQPSRPR